MLQSEELLSLFQAFWLRETKSSTICSASLMSSALHRRRLSDIFWETLHECTLRRNRMRLPIVINCSCIVLSEGVKRENFEMKRLFFPKSTKKCRFVQKVLIFLIIELYLFNGDRCD